jgi:hypothetical protein
MPSPHSEGSIPPIVDPMKIAIQTVERMEFQVL